MRRFVYLFVVCPILLCGMTAAQLPPSNHIWIITEENHSYEEVIDNSSMPYFNTLASQYALASEYYSTQHNSLSALKTSPTPAFKGSPMPTTCADTTR